MAGEYSGVDDECETRVDQRPVAEHLPAQWLT